MRLDPTTTLFERECARIAAEPPLDEDRERELARRWVKHGDRAAADALVRAAMPVVLRQARRLRGYGVPREDLLSEGTLGLLRAVEKFDLRGVRFKTYATYWIRAYMLALALRSGSLVTRATGAVGAKFFFKLRSARARAEALLGPHSEEIDGLLARQFGVSEAQIRAHTERLAHGDVSLDAPVGDDGDATGLDLTPAPDSTPEEATAQLERDQQVHEVLGRVWQGLDERERAIVTHRLLADEEALTLSELGARFDLSRERLRQLEARLKGRLQRALAAEAVTLH